MKAGVRRFTRLEGMLLGALMELAPPIPPRDALCHRAICTQEVCGHCSRIIAAHAVIEKALKLQRRRPAPKVPLRALERESRGSSPMKVDDGRGGKRVGERRQARRTFHIIDAESSARDVAISKSDLTNFFLDVLDKHHGGR